jgi:hypothetical protein
MSKLSVGLAGVHNIKSPKPDGFLSCSFIHKKELPLIFNKVMVALLTSLHGKAAPVPTARV